LSSSSAAANAAVLATLASLGVEPEWREVLRLGIEASFEAGVTLTGAFDDAAASLLGCGVVTDNLRRRILRRFELPPSYKVVIFVPPSKLYTSRVRPSSFRGIADLVEVAHKQALLGNIFGAMTLNGLLYSHALNQDQRIALEAISRGAVAAGLTGKGPAVAAIAHPQDVEGIKEAWGKRKGRIIVTCPSKGGAKIE
jgi:shikimate kinase